MISHDAMTFAEHMAHYALLFMAVVYTIRIIWFTRFPAGKERQAATGSIRTNPSKGAWYSLANIAMPWAMESTRTKPLLYLQFVLFHLGVVAGIALSFVIPFSPRILEIPAVHYAFSFFIGAAFLVGIIRIFRRFVNKYVRAISTPDDHFSLWMLTAWFGFAFTAVPNHGGMGQYIYFWMTTFFLVYVPFSKISHYLYYPFTRYYFGKSMGHRGVYPMKRGKIA